MAMLNYFYFLYGIFLFLAWRLFHLHPYFKRTPYPTPGRSSVWFFIFGSGYLLILINMFLNVDFSYGFDFLILLPTILFVLAIINFWGESFIAPTKNYLIALGLGILIGSLTLLISYVSFLYTGLLSITSYLWFIPFLLGLLVGGVSGKLIHTFLLESRYPAWNTPLWHLNKLWDVVNHSTLLTVVAVLAFIEATLQLKSNSLVLIFSSL